VANDKAAYCPNEDLWKEQYNFVFTEGQHQPWEKLLYFYWVPNNFSRGKDAWRWK
jgi:hypothetical protein